MLDQMVQWIWHASAHPISNCGGKAIHMVLIKQEVSEFCARSPALWRAQDSKLFSSLVSRQKNHTHMGDALKNKGACRRQSFSHVLTKSWQSYSKSVNDRQNMVHISRHSTYCINTHWYKQSSCWISFYDSCSTVCTKDDVYENRPCKTALMRFPFSQWANSPALPNCKSRSSMLSHPSPSNATMAWALEASHGTTW